jgi:hypothetical protein
MTTANTERETVGPEHEPEYVGAHSEPVVDYCCHYIGDAREDVERCGDDATHSIVERTPKGNLVEIAMCDDCGNPDHVDSAFQ